MTVDLLECGLDWDTRMGLSVKKDVKTVNGTRLVLGCLYDEPRARKEIRRRDLYLSKAHLDEYASMVDLPALAMCYVALWPSRFLPAWVPAPCGRALAWLVVRRTGWWAVKLRRLLELSVRRGWARSAFQALDDRYDVRQSPDGSSVDLVRRTVGAAVGNDSEFPFPLPLLPERTSTSWVPFAGTAQDMRHVEASLGFIDKEREVLAALRGMTASM